MTQHTSMECDREKKKQLKTVVYNKNKRKDTKNIIRLKQGCNSLMHACQQGYTNTIVNQLRRKPEIVKQLDHSSKTALHYCSGQRDIVAAASVTAAAPELVGSADEDGFTPLHLAVIQGNTPMVNLLLANNADVNALDKEGHSVVHWATVCGEMEALRMVLACGADISTPDVNGGTPLHYAAQMCGAKYEEQKGTNKLSMEILNVLLSHPKNSVDKTDKDGRQPLLWAASAGSAKAIIALIKAGARVESADKDGLTALHCAASRGHTECIDTLISLCGADTDLIDLNGCTALHYAVTLGHADATSRLLELDADPNRQDRKGRTPAHCGCSKGQFETVKLLKEKGANLWLRNAKGDLPVHEATASGRRELVEWLLLQKTSQVNTTSNEGRSLLHIAATNDYTDICKLLLDLGADVNSIYRTPKGIAMTPLDCALQKGYRSTAKFLQSNRGLPVNKLRLLAHSSSPFCNQDLVKPLKYNEKEELYDLKNSKKYIMYSNRSDSDSGECTCAEHIYKKEHRINHVCSHHRKEYRRRTNSCGETIGMIKDEGSSDISRSKSNIEIHRKRSRERFSSSDVDSCEHCCRHKRKKKFRKKNRGFRKITKTIDIKDITPIYPKQFQEDLQKQFFDENENYEDNKLDLMSSHQSKPGSGNRNRPKSAKRRQSVEQSSQTNEELAKEIKNNEVMTVHAEVHKEDEKEQEDKIDIKNEELVTLKQAENQKVESLEEELQDIEKLPEENKIEVIEVPKEIEIQLNEIQDENAEILSVVYKNVSITEKLDDTIKENEAILEEQTQNNDGSTETKNTEELKEKQVTQDDFEKNAAEKSFELLAENSKVETTRRSSFQVLKNDESFENDKLVNTSKEPRRSFEIVQEKPENSSQEMDYTSVDDDKKNDNNLEFSNQEKLKYSEDNISDENGGRKKRHKRKIRTSDRPYSWRTETLVRQTSKDHDSGFEPSPRSYKSKIPTPKSSHAIMVARKPIYATLDGRSCPSRVEGRKPGEHGACNMSAVTRSIQRNIRRYYVEKKIFQHLLALKSLQIRSNKLNEPILVKRAVDEYHKSCIALGAETGGTMPRYPYTEYTFKNFEMFLYETLKGLQKYGTNNFQNISEVYAEAERRLSPDYKYYERALLCTSKTHRCLHATHAYTGIPCAAYIPMMNHHTIPKLGYGSYKTTGIGSFYLPKILTNHSKPGSKVSLELSHGKQKQLISLPSDKLDSNKRYYVTFTVKGNESTATEKAMQQETHTMSSDRKL